MRKQSLARISQPDMRQQTRSSGSGKSRQKAQLKASRDEPWGSPLSLTKCAGVITSFFLLALALAACTSPPPPQVPPVETRCQPEVAKQCAQKEASCLSDLGDKAQTGPIRERNYQKAAEYWECGCEADDAGACRRLGILSMQGMGAPSELGRAEELLQVACEEGDGDGCAWLGLLWVQMGEKKPAEAIPWIRKGCDMGGTMACGRLGAAYVLGKYVDRQDLPQGKMLLSAACEQGDGYACRMMGEVARGQEKNEARAVEWYQKACALEDAEGCFQLGNSRTNRSVTERDEQKGAAAFERGCLFGSGEACNVWGEMTQEGRGTAKDPSLASALFKESCAGRSPAGCTNWGLALASGRGIQANIEAAFEPMHFACEHKSAPACQWLGEQFASGENTHPAKALEYFDQACQMNDWAACRRLLEESGTTKSSSLSNDIENRMKASCTANPDACYQLALLLGTGNDAEERATERLTLFQKACNGAVTSACVEAGSLLAHVSKGSEAQYKEAYELLSTHCEKGNPQACNELGYLYANGIGVTKDRASALKLFVDACDAGQLEACRRAAVGYQNGYGVSKNAARAQELTQKACELGCKECCRPEAK